jgi:hypothetical protein
MASSSYALCKKLNVSMAGFFFISPEVWSLFVAQYLMKQDFCELQEFLQKSLNLHYVPLTERGLTHD